MVLHAAITDATTIVYTESVYQHDKNATLLFEGVDLPEEYKVIFSNTKDRGISIECEGNQNGVAIPDELLSTGEYIYAWVRIGDEDSGKHTVCAVTIPVIPRPVPISVQKSSSGSGVLQYSIDAEDENLNFLSAVMNGMIQPNIEEET